MTRQNPILLICVDGVTNLTGEKHSLSVKLSELRGVVQKVTRPKSPTDLGREIAEFFSNLILEEEFVVLFHKLNTQNAKALADKVRKGVEKEYIIHGDRELRVTVSLGVSSAKIGDGESALFDYVHS